MITLLLLSLLVQDDRKEERDRIEMLKRVAPAMLETEARSSSTPPTITYGTFDRNVPYLSDVLPLYSTGKRTTTAYDLGTLATRTTGVRVAGDSRLPGFFLDEKGLFVTTCDAVKGRGKDGTVRLSDGRSMKATLVTSDEHVGLALLRLESADPTKPLALGDSAGVSPGQTVVIATFAGDAVVLRKAAVISRHRSAVDLYSAEDFIHIDYAALPHEIGAPVLTLDGAVVGIIAETAYESTGEGRVPRRCYAIPSATIKAFLAKRSQAGTFELGIVGVSTKDVEKGCRIESVSKESAAEKAGLQPGDVIVAIDGKPVKDALDLQRATKFRARETVEVTFTRADGTMKVKLTVGVWEPAKPEPEPHAQVRDRLGLEVVGLTDDLRKFLDLGERNGVVIQRVMAGSLAEQAGLRKGDAITSVDNVAVESVDQFLAKARAVAKDSYVVLDTWRDGKRVPVVIKMK